MKRLLLLIPVIISCAKGGGSSPAPAGACSNHPIIGSWRQDSNTASITEFKADCSGSNNTCGSAFSFPNATATSGTALIQITASSNSASCLSVGSHTCTFAVSGSQLGFNCDGMGTTTYTKVQ